MRRVVLFEAELAGGLVGEVEEGVVAEVVGLELGLLGELAGELVGELFELLGVGVGGGEGEDAVEGGEDPDAFAHAEVEVVDEPAQEGGVGGDGGGVLAHDADHLDPAPQALADGVAQGVPLLGEIAQRNDLTVLMVTHEPEAAAHCQRVFIIHDGRVLFCRSDLRLRAEEQRVWSLWEAYKAEHERNRQAL